jgi:hypothetical protein
MKYYDYEKAKEIITKSVTEIDEASLGMREDLDWTIDSIWNKEKGFLVDLDDNNLVIAGIKRSYWATPCLILKKGKSEILLDCYKTE